jgi:hypothetical protein
VQRGQLLREACSLDPRRPIKKVVAAARRHRSFANVIMSIRDSFCSKAYNDFMAREVIEALNEEAVSILE